MGFRVLGILYKDIWGLCLGTLPQQWRIRTLVGRSFQGIIKGALAGSP